MPELPEVEIVRQSLNKKIKGKINMHLGFIEPIESFPDKC